MRNYASRKVGTNAIEKNDIIFEVCTKFVLLFLLVIHGRSLLSTSGLYYTKHGFSGFHSYRNWNTYVKLQIGKYHFLEMWDLC